jgi:NAD(P)H-nitrite reductase large subunit
LEHIVIIGNGIAGTTAARHIRKNSTVAITIISNESKYFFSRTALMYVYMGHMKFEHTQPYEDDFWEKNKIDLLFDTVESIDFDSNKIQLTKNESIVYTKLIIATGSKSNFFDWKGQDANGVLGLYHKQDLEKLIELTPKIKKAVVIGGGLIGIELCEMLTSQNKEVTFLIRENSFWNTVLPKQESKMVSHHIKEHHVNLIENKILKEIITDSNNNVVGIVTEDDEKMECDFVGITVGVSPNIDFLKNSKLKINRGILVNKYLETNISNVFAIGDCAELTEPKIGRKPIEAVWYCGRMMGETVAQTITKLPAEYKPNSWFNSAKFFDIEYVTYGKVNSIPLPEEKQLFWKHPSKNCSLRISYDEFSGEVLGVIGMGMRLKHEFFNQVLNEKWSIETLIQSLNLANFDPEFFENYTHEIQNKLIDDLKTAPYAINKKLSFNCSI